LDNQEMTMEHRRNLLQREIVKYVNQGYQVQSSTDTQVVMSKKKKIKLITHILIALLTAGIWLIVPLIQIINRKQNTIVLSVDQFGNIRKD
jgi:radical SAM superfamily enzyme